MTLHTLLFTDLVDSTRLVERIGDERAAQLWAEHDRRARNLLALHHGLEIDRTDGFFLLFDNVADAARYAMAYHLAIAELELSPAAGVAAGPSAAESRLAAPTRGLSARAGIHVGPVTLRENAAEDVARGAKRIEVEGLSKPFAARVMALAGAGQTLLSASARAALAELLDGALPENTDIDSHGHYRLKGVEEPAEVFELGVRGHSAFTPPPDTDKAYRVVRAGGLWRPLREVRHNLAPERDAFIGRSIELRALAHKLDAGARLLTVLGPGGTGKTRFVRRYGLSWLGDWPGGVYFCDLSEARSLDGIWFAVAFALGVQLGKDDPGLQLGHAIAGRGRCLVILDNFEQVIEHAPATVGRWLDRAAEAAFAVTSRERLLLSGEEIFPIEPLPLDKDAIDLFAARARAQRPDFVLSDANRAAVAEVVRLLDGLPLAIELAAARARVFSPRQLVERMKDRFSLLAGARGTAARQATLKAAIDWSWGLLAPYEQAALAQCSVFEGGFTLDAAEAVLDLQPWPEAPASMDVVQALVDKSLLRAWVPRVPGRLDIDEPYFGMYLSIHEYAAARLAAGGDGATRSAQARHGGYFATFGGDEAIQALSQHGGIKRLRALAFELDNLVAACRRALARADPAVAVACACAAWEVLELRGPFAAGVALASQVSSLEALPPTLAAVALQTLARAYRRSGQLDQAAAVLARALGLAGELAERGRQASLHRLLGTLDRERGRFDAAQQHLEAALMTHRDMGNRNGEGIVLVDLGNWHWEQGRIEQALASYESARTMLRDVGNLLSEGAALGNLGLLHSQAGRMEQAQANYAAALAIDRETGNRGGEGLLLGNLALVFMDQGRHEEALTHLQQSLAIVRDVGDRRFEGRVLGNLCCLRIIQGRLGEARTFADASLAVHREVGNRRSEGIMLGNLGDVLREQGRFDEALAHYHQALALHRELGNRRSIGSTQCSVGEVLFRQGRLADARAALACAEPPLREIGERFELGKLLCVRGKVDARAGDLDLASAALAEAESIVIELGSGPESELGLLVAKLREALA